MSHAVQAREPVSFLYVPASHGRQGPPAGPVCPGPHDVGEEEFAVALEAFAAACREEFVPLAEAFPAAAPVLQAEPTPHGETSGSEVFVPLTPLPACAASAAQRGGAGQHSTAHRSSAPTARVARAQAGRPCMLRQRLGSRRIKHVPGGRLHMGRAVGSGISTLRTAPASSAARAQTPGPIGETSADGEPGVRWWADWRALAESHAGAGAAACARSSRCDFLPALQ